MLKPSHHDILHLLHTDLTGFHIRILRHSDPKFRDLEGLVIKETRQMLLLQINQDQIMVSKQPGLFEITLETGSCHLEGYLLEGDAKRRSKRHLRRW